MYVEQGVDSDVVPNEYQGVVTSNSHFLYMTLTSKTSSLDKTISCFVLYLLLLEELTETYV